MKPGIHSVKQDASNSELQKAIEAAQPYAVKQMAGRAEQFKGTTEKETCKKIFDYLKHNIKYKADGDEQQVRLPSGLIRTGTGDCKSYALFTSAVLSNLGIPHYLTYASYNSDPTPTHVYVTTKNGCIVDAVWGKFNSEKQANHKINKPMNISYIAGVRGHRKRIGALSTITLSIPRQILLGLYSTNVDGLATIASKNMGPLEAKWVKMGGSLSAIRAAVADGVKKPVKSSGALTRLKSWIQEKASSKGIKINGTMIGATAESNAAIKKMLTDGGSISISYRALLDTLGAVIGGFVASVVPGVGTAAGAGAGATIGEILYGQTGTLVDAMFPITSGSTTTTPVPTDTTSTDASTSSSSSINPLYIVAAAGAAYLLLKKR